MVKTRLRHAKFISTLIMMQPFVRAVMLNGSLAQGTAAPTSDIDLMVVARSGRIFTARFFTSLVVWLTGLKRGSSEGAPHAGRVCLNYYLTEGFLIVPHHRDPEMNKYCAESYSSSILMAGDRALFQKFMKMNERWMGQYIKVQKSKIKIVSPREDNPKGPPWGVQTRQIMRRFSHRLWRGPAKCGDNLASRREIPLWGTIKQFLERALSGKSGQRLENYLKRVQLARINRDPRTKAFPDLIYADDREMRFHPPKETNC